MEIPAHDERYILQDDIPFENGFDLMSILDARETYLR